MPLEQAKQDAVIALQQIRIGAFGLPIHLPQHIPLALFGLTNVCPRLHRIRLHLLPLHLLASDAFGIHFELRQP